MIIPRALERLVAQKKCVAFVGAGFSMPVGMPSWYGLLEYILEGSHEIACSDEDYIRISQFEHALEMNDLMLAASLAKRIYGSNQLNQKIAECFSRSRFHKATVEQQCILKKRLDLLLGIPWAGVITTNYDDLIEMGLDAKKSSGSYYNVIDTVNFGTSLTQTHDEQRFFVKLHGCVRSQRFVLGPEEYDGIYLANPRITSYMTSVMLNYHLVFLGCSLEDEMLRLRRKLCLDFDGEIPLAYALLPSTPKNVARRQDLVDFAKIQCLMYAAEDHQSLEFFMEKIEKAYRENYALSDSIAASHLQSALLNMSVEDRLASIGEINRNLVNSITEAGEVVSQIDFIGNVKKLLTRNGHPSLSDAEIVYRAHFLVSIGLLVYHSNDEGHIFFGAKNSV